MSYLRIWHERVPRELGDEYEKFLVERAVPDYRSVPGLERIYFSRHDEKRDSLPTNHNMGVHRSDEKV